MSGMPRLDTAVTAASVVGMADQVMEGIRDNHNHRPDDAHAHYVKAAIAGAIAIGAYEMLKRDEAHGKKRSHGATDTQPGNDASHGHHTHHHDHSHQHSGHSNDMIAQTLGAYALGRQMMGHSDHNILKLVAEGLGVAGLAREVDRELVKY